MRPGLLMSCRTGAVVVLTSFFLLTGGAEAQAQERGQGPPGAVPAGPDAAGEAGRPYHPDRLIVQFRPGRAAAFLPGSGKARSLRGDGLFLVPLPPGLPVAEAVRRYAGHPDVLFAEPDYTASLSLEPNDERWSEQWNMVRIAAPAAWETQTSSADVVVAVVDSGINFSHPDLQANLWTDPLDGSHGFTCLNGTVTPGGQDDNGHGTHVAGILGAVGNNGLGVAGVDWSVQLLSLKAFKANGTGNISDIVLCIDKLTELRQSGINLRVGNHSWTTGGFSQALADAITRAESAGVLQVCAAGNSSLDIDVSPAYPAALPNRGILTVSATDSADAPASFTSYGHAGVDLAAPGVDILSTVLSGTCANCDPSGFKLLSGTSMATPHVSGVAAALFHLNPLLTPAEARDVLLDPASFDPVSSTSARAYSTTRGRLSFSRVLANPLVAAPQLNGFPTISTPEHVARYGGTPVTLSATTSDPDGDTLKHQWAKPHHTSLVGNMINHLFGPGSVYPPVVNSNPYNFTVPPLARTATVPYLAFVNDGRGGSARSETLVTILASPTPGQPPRGTVVVTPDSGPPGTVVNVSYSGSDPEGGTMLWGYFGAGGVCCYSTLQSFNVTLSSAGVYRISGQAIDRELNLSPVSSVVVRIGGATGEPPVADLAIDVASGPPPLTVSYDATGSYDPDGSTLTYFPSCEDSTGLGVTPAGPPTGTCTFTEPGPHTIRVSVRDANSYYDERRVHVMVTPEVPPGAAAPTVAITAPANGAAVQGLVQVEADASDDVGVARVEIYRDSGVLLGIDTEAPYGIPWDSAAVTPGTHTLYAKAYDGLDIVTTSAAVTVTVLDATAPSVAITNPSSGSNVVGSVTVAISASDNVGVTRVELYRDSDVLIGTDTASPWSLVWDSAASPPGNRTLHARAYDQAGNVATSAPVTLRAIDIVPPTVAVTSPTSGASLAGFVTLAASASDNAGVTRVEFFRDQGFLLGTDTTEPFEIPWDSSTVAPGAHMIYAKAWDADSNGTTSTSIAVTVIDVVAPTVAMTLPAPGSALSGSVTLRADASDNAGVARVEFYRDTGILLGTDTTSFYIISWDSSTASSGAHTLYAIAYDNAGNATTSAPVNVTVLDTTAPTVAITSPADGSTVTKNTVVTLQATASDDVGVTRVEFYVGTTLTCTDTTSPYTCAWTVPKGASQQFSLQARAYDARGNVGTSAIVRVTSR